MSDPSTRALAAVFSPAQLGAALRDALDDADVGCAVNGGEPLVHLYVNAAACRLLGAGPEVLVGRSAYAGLAPEVRARAAERRRRRQAGEPITTAHDTVILRADGTRLPVELRVTDLTLRGLPASVVFFTDVSERQRTAAALAAAEHRFRQLVERNADGMVVVQGTAIVYANPAVARLVGVATPEDMLGLSVYPLLQPDDTASIDARRAEIGHLVSLPAIERRLRRPDGESRAIEISLIRLEPEAGEPRVLACVRDVGERRALEERILQQDRLATIGGLATGVAHELEAPLGELELELTAALAHLPPAQDPGLEVDLRRRIGDALEGVTRVGAIIGDLLALSSADTTPQPTDARRALDSALKLVRADMSRRARLELDLRDLPLVHGNPARLGQVFLNLLINATQALPERPIDENLVRVAARAFRDHVEIEVQDNGPGIPENILPRIFEPFFTTKPTGVGTGLGLSVSRSLVAAMGGVLSAHNLSAGGAAFLVSLPTI